MAPTTPPARILRLAPARVTETVRLSLEPDLLNDGPPAGWIPGTPAAHDARFTHPRPANVRALRGKTRDRLETWGTELFESRWLPRLKPDGVARIQRAFADGKDVVIEADALDHAMRPLARHLGVRRFVARSLEFREDRATGRLQREARLIDLDEPVADPVLLVDDPRDSSLRPGAFSVRRSLEGRRILAAGASGFLGKVWLAKLLHDLPELGEVTVLLRPRRDANAAERFRELLATSPVFDPLRESPTDDLVRLLDRVRVVDGDVGKRDLGLDPAVRDELQQSVDLVVSFAGQTDFNPDLRDALAANVDATVYLLDFVRGCRNAALLHVSTCFVAGAREGRVSERLLPFETPLGLPFDPEGERRRLHETVDAHLRQARGGGAQARPFRRALIEAGRRRALELGWPNIYTFTKALGEALLVTRGADLPVAVVRPSIVETSTDFPRRGWAEGTNTSAPLSHLLGTPFRHLPVNERKRLDVIPVDTVARGTTLVAAALVARRHRPVYHLATSVANPLDLRRAVELTALAHRRHYRQMRQLKHRLLERMETVPVSRERYRRLSVPLQLRVVRALNRIVAYVSGHRPLGRFERQLRRVHDLIDLYEPFLLHNEPVFEAENVERLAAALPDAERDAFGYDVSRIDWYEYWVDVHIPALRQWSYPLLERRQGAEPEAAAPLRLAEPSADVASGGA